MELDLRQLHLGEVESIFISGEYILPSNYYENTEILELKPIRVKGNIIRKENEKFFLAYYMEGVIQGTMAIADSISLKKVYYPFKIVYADFLPENCIKNENTLDIFSFLWENIVLEVPLYFTEVTDISKFHGDGWKLVHEDEYKDRNNPFSDLLKDFEEE